MQALNLNDDRKMLTKKSLTGNLVKKQSMPLSSKSGSTFDVTSYASDAPDQYSKPSETLDWNVQKLTDLHKKEMERCNKYKAKDAKRHYDFLAKNYEGIYNTVGYPDPEHVAKHVAKYA